MAARGGPVLATVVAFLLVGCVTPARERSGTSHVAEQLSGSWRLVEYERRTPSGGITFPFGPSPNGRLTYDAQGRMAVQIMDPRRPRFGANDYRRGEPAEIEQAFEGYFAYFGTYSIDERAGTITHEVSGCLYPNYAGRSETRYFTLAGDRLTLRTPPKTVDGVEGIFELCWKRER